MIKTHSLTPQAKSILIDKGTEAPYTNKDQNLKKNGSYLCKNCGVALFKSKDKFHSNCGWPSFDKELPNTVKKVLDLDNVRMEILCNKCDGHLGHIFYGERLTDLNTRYCVNSTSIEYIDYNNINDTEEAILGAGCFWGVECYLQKLKGVVKTEVGYIGGFVDSPTYEQVCSTNTGHVEVIRVVYDHKVIGYEQLIKYFFEIHDFTQDNGQGPDIGEQYLSKIFYYNDDQYQIAKNIIKQLENRGHKVATKLEAMSPFWLAEEYHQNYYINKSEKPYCHLWHKIF